MRGGPVTRRVSLTLNQQFSAAALHLSGARASNAVRSIGVDAPALAAWPCSSYQNGEDFGRGWPPPGGKGEGGAI